MTIEAMGIRYIKKKSRNIFEFSYFHIKSEALNVKQYLKYLEKICDHMKESSYFFRALHVIEKSLKEQNFSEDKKVRLICYGLGNFTFNINAIHQFAFLLCLKQKLKLSEIYIYDPCFTKDEFKILGLNDCIVSNVQFQKKYSANCTTIFYLPHCHFLLTDETLFQNWSPQYLKNMILINNSFENYLKIKNLKRHAPYMYKALKHVTEIPLENDYKDEYIFNDLSVHIFLPDNLPKVDSEIWVKKLKRSAKCFHCCC